MTLLIACFLISGFEMSWLWYPISFIVWIMHLAVQND